MKKEDIGLFRVLMLAVRLSKVEKHWKYYICKKKKKTGELNKFINVYGIAQWRFLCIPRAIFTLNIQIIWFYEIAYGSMLRRTILSDYR